MPNPRLHQRARAASAAPQLQLGFAPVFLFAPRLPSSRYPDLVRPLGDCLQRRLGPVRDWRACPGTVVCAGGPEWGMFGVLALGEEERLEFVCIILLPLRFVIVDRFGSNCSRNEMQASEDFSSIRNRRVAAAESIPQSPGPTPLEKLACKARLDRLAIIYYRR